MANCLFCAVSVPPTYFIEADGKVIKIKSGINGSFNGKSFQLEDAVDSLVHDEIKTFFVLKNVLYFSNKFLSEILSLCEGDSHPEHWVNVCKECGNMLCQFYVETKYNLRSEGVRQSIAEKLRRAIYESKKSHNEDEGGPIWRMIRSEALKDFSFDESPNDEQIPIDNGNNAPYRINQQLAENLNDIQAEGLKREASTSERLHEGSLEANGADNEKDPGNSGSTSGGKNKNRHEKTGNDHLEKQEPAQNKCSNVGASSSNSKPEVLLVNLVSDDEAEENTEESGKCRTITAKASCKNWSVATKYKNLFTRLNAPKKKGEGETSKKIDLNINASAMKESSLMSSSSAQKVKMKKEGIEKEKSSEQLEKDQGEAVAPTKAKWSFVAKKEASSYTRPPTPGPPRSLSPILIDLESEDDEKEGRDQAVTPVIPIESATGSQEKGNYPNNEEILNRPMGGIQMERDEKAKELVVSQTPRHFVPTQGQPTLVLVVPDAHVPAPPSLVVPPAPPSTTIVNGVDSIALGTTKPFELNQQPKSTEIPATFSQLQGQSSTLVGSSTPTLLIEHGSNDTGAKTQQNSCLTTIPTFNTPVAPSAADGVVDDEFYLVELSSPTLGIPLDTAQIPPEDKTFLVRRKTNQPPPPVPVEEACILEKETTMLGKTPLEVLKKVAKPPAILRESTLPLPTYVASNKPTAVSAEKGKPKSLHDITKANDSTTALKHTLSETSTLLLLPRQLPTSASHLPSQPGDNSVASAPATSTSSDAVSSTSGPRQSSSPQTVPPSLTKNKEPTQENPPAPNQALPYILQKVGSAAYFKCKMCPALKTSLLYIETHLKLHHENDANYTLCEICNYPLLTEKLEQHRSLRHPPTPSEIHNSSLPPSRNFPGKEKAASHYKCSHCPATLSNSSTMKAHQRLHLEDSSAIVCPEPRCGWFVLRERMAHHHGRHHPENHAKCVPCSQLFFNDNDQHEHLKLHELSQVSDVCGSRSTDLTQHYALQHAMDNEDGNGMSSRGTEGNQKGSPLPSSPITRTENLELVEQEIPEASWKCGKCTDEFLTEAALHEHERKKHVAVNVFDFDDDDGRVDCDAHGCGWRTKNLEKHKAKYHPPRKLNGSETPVEASSTSSKKREVKQKKVANDAARVEVEKSNKKTKLPDKKKPQTKKKKSVASSSKPRSKPYYGCTKNGMRFYKCYECGHIVKKLNTILKHVEKHYKSSDEEDASGAFENN